MSTTIKEIFALRRLIDDETREFQKLIEQYNAEIKTKVKEYELVLQKEFYQKYGESFRDVCIAYMKFFHQDDHLAATDGYSFYVPILLHGKRINGDEVITKHGICFMKHYPSRTKMRLRPKHYKECIPTQKIIDAFKCMGEFIYVSPVIS